MGCTEAGKVGKGGIAEGCTARGEKGGLGFEVGDFEAKAGILVVGG